MTKYDNINININQPEINAETLPAGPRGRGIESISQHENLLTVTYDDGAKQDFFLPDWWFGTKSEYNKLSVDEKRSKSLYFIEEGT